MIVSCIRFIANEAVRPSPVLSVTALLWAIARAAGFCRIWHPPVCASDSAEGPVRSSSEPAALRNPNISTTEQIEVINRVDPFHADQSWKPCIEWLCPCTCPIGQIDEKLLLNNETFQGKLRSPGYHISSKYCGGRTDLEEWHGKQLGRSAVLYQIYHMYFRHQSFVRNCAGLALRASFDARPLVKLNTGWQPITDRQLHLHAACGTGILDTPCTSTISRLRFMLSQAISTCMRNMHTI